MTVVQDHACDAFIAAGLVAHDVGVPLPEAIVQLAVRLKVKGAGDLLDQLMRLDWTAPLGSDKRDPKPTPTPKPPPPPTSPPPGQS